MFDFMSFKVNSLLHKFVRVRVDRQLTLRYLAKSLKKNACIVDVGAGTGSFSRSIMELGGQSGENVHLIEPVNSTFNVMKESNPDLHAHHFAVAKFSGDISIFISDSADKWAWKSATISRDSIKEKFGSVGVRELKVQAISLTEFYKLQELTMVDLLALNCEGAEYEIFDGNTDFLDQTRMVWIELHGRTKAFWKLRQKRTELYDLLEARGFTLVGGHKRNDLTTSNDHMMHLWEKLS